MKRRESTLLVMAAVAIIVVGAMPMALREEGVQFTDGSVQVTAAMSAAEIARGGINHSCRLILGDGAGENWAGCNFEVPAGHILVVEYVSLLGLAPSGIGLEWGCFDTVPGDARTLTHAPLSRQSRPGEERYEAGQLYRAYVGGERTFEMFILRDSNVGEVDVTVAFSGYLVPV